MPTPTPRQGENRDDFVSRCVPAISDEYGNNQATAICISAWNDQSKEYQTWKAFDDEAQRFERKYSPKIRKALMQGVQPVIDTFNGQNPKSELFDFTYTEEVLKEIYEVVGVNFGLRQIEEQKKKYPKLQTKADTDYRNILVDEMLIYFNGDFQKILTSTGKYTQEIIDMVGSRVFRQATEEGWGIRKTARALEKQFDLRSRSRANTIARTETLRAASVGDLNGINKVAQELNMRVQTRWIATFDKSARNFHMSLDGQTIIEGVQVFNDGISNLRYPRDAQADPRSTINCRCSTGHQLID